MPVSYHISPTSACIIVKLEGTVTDIDLLQEQQRMLSDPLFQGSYVRLVDATDVVTFAVTADTVRSLAQTAVEAGLRKAALVSNNKVWVYGLMRMYQSYADPPADVAVHHNVHEALIWLTKP
jgi:hypothetical protein